MSTTKKIPLRKCIGCGEMKNKKELLRVLKTSENEIIFDVTGKKNGRGAYLCADSECLEKAIKKRGLDRSFKMSVPSEVYEHLTEEMKKLGTR